MGLVRFTFDDEKSDAIAPPPDDALARATWLHLLLCQELHNVVTDEALTESERREAIAMLATKITQATPNHEIEAARRKIAAYEKETEEQPPLAGGVTSSAKTGHTGALRANAPRGRKPKKG